MGQKKQKYLIVGIDEVGRGPLAGDVFVCACAYFDEIPHSIRQVPMQLRDSKKLSKKRRDEWVRYIKKEQKAGSIFISIKRETNKTIDRINIARAIERAAHKALLGVIKKSGIKKGIIECHCDGGLFVSVEIKHIDFISSTTIKGDDVIPVISLASINAKVARDAYMDKLHKIYPQYGFKRNKGYGTKEHIQMIRKYGKTRVHRKSFIEGILKHNSK